MNLINADEIVGKNEQKKHPIYFKKCTTVKGSVLPSLLMGVCVCAGQITDEPSLLSMVEVAVDEDECNVAVGEVNLVLLTV